MPKLAKKTEAQLHPKFDNGDLRHHLARGIHATLAAIEKALQEGREVCEQVWIWVQTQIGNSRAKTLLEVNRPDLFALATKSA